MWILLLPMLAQVPLDRAVVEAEHARAQGLPALRAALAPTGARQASANTLRRAARALGRLESADGVPLLLPLLASADATVRTAAYGALAQLRAPYARQRDPQQEPDAVARAALYEWIGRATPIDSSALSLLVRGLDVGSRTVRIGAARGMESLYRLNTRTSRPSEAAITALQQSFVIEPSAEFRQLALLTLIRATVTDSATIAIGLADTSAQVRRLAVLLAKRWVDDPSPMVRVEALRFTDDCARLSGAAMRDPSDHVAIAAISQLAARACDPTFLADVVRSGRRWQHRTAALLALTTRDTARARAALPAFVRDTVKQVRAHAAEAARILRDTAALRVLVRDPEPTVVAAAISTPEEALRVLRSDHAGLLLAAAENLKGAARLDTLLPRLVSVSNRLTAEGSMTLRDPRAALLTRIGEVPDTSTNGLLRDLLGDRDPAIAAQAAAILSVRTGATVQPQTTRLPVPPIPSAGYIAALHDARAIITMRGLGTMTFDLLTDEAPVTVGVFAQLAESGQYASLTFHRIVSNFVVQGGSPGANEYDGRTREFMRDEVGFARNRRGTIGISTRGRDTGDGQIYLNLIDNYRLDRDYTVMASMRDGIDVMDRIQEGDVIERIEIVRTTSPVCRPGSRPSRRASRPCR